MPLGKIKKITAAFCLALATLSVAACTYYDRDYDRDYFYRRDSWRDRYDRDRDRARDDYWRDRYGRYRDRDDYWRDRYARSRVDRFGDRDIDRD